LSVLDTNPSSFLMASAEILPIGIDVTALLSTGQSIGEYSITVTDYATASPVTLADTPAVSGNVVTQIIRGSELQPSSTYRVNLVFNAAPSVAVWQTGFDLVLD